EAWATDLTNPPNGGQFDESSQGTSAPINVTGLTNGDLYSFAVVNVIQVGDTVNGSAPSAPSNTVTPAGPPGAPTIGKATPGNGQATVAFTAPGSNGGQPIIDYTVTAKDETDPAQGGQTASGSASPITVRGLSNGHSYTFSVIAINDAGKSAPSSGSNPVVPAGPPKSTPGAPTKLEATASDGKVTVSFAAPENTGGSPILGYTVTATDLTEPSRGGQSAAGTTSPIAITDLTNNDQYTFRVTATNDLGTGPASANSNTVVPKRAE
ncbi:MAG TPA: fibronectin type III domain-containing protein, partial [Acidimicrobiales bacterium]